MKRVTAAALMLLALLMLTAAPLTAGAAKAKPTRTINLVFDDSNSMIEDGGEFTDRWCQAKYALEVFAAMLDENDTMNVFAMSPFYRQNIDYSSIQPMTLYGSSGPAANVSQIHGTVTRSSGTPFQTVEAAYTNLRRASADEKWLVVLTDGEFTRDFENLLSMTEVNSYFNAKDDDVSVMYLAIGKNANSIIENPAKNIFAYSALNSTDILGRLTEMSNRIFERNRLRVDPGSGAFSFDIPMGELIVFAQGKDVSIGGIKDAEGNAIAADGAPVEVRYSEQASTADRYADNPSIIVNRNLVGQLAYFHGDYAPGDYTVDAPGADTIEIYYRPNVDIAVHLVNSEGTRLSASDPIPQGSYRLEYGFVKPGTDEFLPESELLGEIAFSAAISINGQSDGKTYANGDTVDVLEGSLDIDATAEYLDYNTVSTSLHYDVFENKPLVFTLDDSVEYILTPKGFKNADEPMTLDISLKDRPFTQEEWDALETPRIEWISQGKAGDLQITKTDTVGRFEIRPTIYKDKPLRNTRHDLRFHVSLQQRVGDSVWSGQTDGTMHIKDRILPWILLLLLLLLLLFLFWITRKVLPRGIRLKQNTTRFIIAAELEPQRNVAAKVGYNRKNRTLKITSPPASEVQGAACSVTLMLKPVDRRYVRSKDRRIMVTGVSPSGSVYLVKIGPHKLTKNEEGQWTAGRKRREAAQEKQKQASLEIACLNAKIEMATGTEESELSRCVCQIQHV